MNPRQALDAGDGRDHLAGMTDPGASPPSAAAQARGYLEALLLVAGSTLLGLALAPSWGNSAVDLLYLPAVIAAAVLAGLGPALFAALLAALAYNFFFTAPHFTFRIDNPNDLVTVVILFAVAVVTSQLAASVRRQARIAEAHAARNATIGGLARRLLSCTDEAQIAAVSVRQLADLFGCNAVLLAGDGGTRVIASVPAAIELAASDIAVAALVLDSGEKAGRFVDRAVPTEWQFHPVRSENATIAVIALARDDGAPPARADQMLLLDNLLDQVALALRRGRLEEEVREFARVRERDQVRATLLATIGQDLRPGLQAVGAAASALKRGGTADKAQVSTISAEVAKAERYLANLLELDPEDEQRPLRAGDVSIDLFQRAVLRGGEAVHLTPKEYAVLAELAKHPGRVLSHAHLLRVAWGPAQEGQVDYLRVAISGLRQKLEREPSRPRLIVNEPAVGYRLNMS